MEQLQKKALDFNLQLMEPISDVCAPLYDKGITHFAFLRFFPTGILRLADREDWLKIYFEKGFFKDQDIYQGVFNGLAVGHRHRRYLANDPTSDHLHQLHKCDLGHFMLNYQHEGNYVDFWCYGASAKNDNMVGFYRDNKGFLDDFLKTFKKRMSSHIIKDGKGENLIKTGNASLGIDPRDIRLEIEFFNGTRVVRLSPHEARCASLVTMGYKPSQLSCELGMDPKSVEACLKGLKIKLDVPEYHDVARILSNDVVSAL